MKKTIKLGFGRRLNIIPILSSYVYIKLHIENKPPSLLYLEDDLKLIIYCFGIPLPKPITVLTSPQCSL